MTTTTSANDAGILPSYPNEIQLQEEAMAVLVNYLQTFGANRSAFGMTKADGATQALPGVSVPPWLVQAADQIAGHPATPYNHDRALFIKDAIFAFTAAWASVLMQYTPPGSAEGETLAAHVHIIRQEQALRSDLLVQEMLQINFVEDLALASGVLQLKMNAGSRRAVYDQLTQLFHFVQEVKDTEFWRPTLQRMMLNVPEVARAIEWLAENPMYRSDNRVSAWLDMLQSIREDG